MSRTELNQKSIDFRRKETGVMYGGTAVIKIKRKKAILQCNKNLKIILSKKRMKKNTNVTGITCWKQGKFSSIREWIRGWPRKY